MEYLRVQWRERKRGIHEERKLDLGSEIIGIFISFCLGKRRLTESEMKGKSAWGPREIIIVYAQFSSHIECGLQIRKLQLDTFINSAGLCQMLVPDRVASPPEQQRKLCGYLIRPSTKAPGLQTHLTLYLHLSSLSCLLLGLATQQTLVQL